MRRQALGFLAGFLAFVVATVPLSAEEVTAEKMAEMSNRELHALLATLEARLNGCRQEVQLVQFMLQGFDAEPALPVLRSTANLRHRAWHCIGRITPQIDLIREELKRRAKGFVDPEPGNEVPRAEIEAMIARVAQWESDREREEALRNRLEEQLQKMLEDRELKADEHGLFPDAPFGKPHAEEPGHTAEEWAEFQKLIEGQLREEGKLFKPESRVAVSTALARAVAGRHGGQARIITVADLERLTFRELSELRREFDERIFLLNGRFQFLSALFEIQEKHAEGLTEEQRGHLKESIEWLTPAVYFHSLNLTDLQKAVVAMLEKRIAAVAGDEAALGRWRAERNAWNQAVNFLGAPRIILLARAALEAAGFRLEPLDAPRPKLDGLVLDSLAGFELPNTWLTKVLTPLVKLLGPEKAAKLVAWIAVYSAAQEAVREKPLAECGVDHIKTYTCRPQSVSVEGVAIRGQFDEGLRPAEPGSLYEIGTPVSKNGELLLDSQAHFTFFRLAKHEEQPPRDVLIRNQFGLERLTLGDAYALAVPSEKVEIGSKMPTGSDHYLLYRVTESESYAVSVDLTDQFVTDQPLKGHPFLFGVPVEKRHGRTTSEIQHEESHILFYELSGGRRVDRERKFNNQFGSYDVEIFQPHLLGVPSEKLFWQAGK